MISKNVDYNGIASYLLNDPFFLSPRFDEEETVDQAWSKFIKPIEDTIQLFVPTKTIVARHSNKRTKKYSGLIRCAMTKKRRLWRSYRTNRTTENKSLYGYFYRFVNGKLSCKSGVGPLKTDFDKLILDDTEKLKD